VDPVGVALAVGAGASYAVYATASKPLVERMGVVPGMTVAFAGGGLLLLPALATTDLSWLAEPAGPAVAAWLGLGTVAVAYLLFGLGLRALDVATVATLSLAEPGVATVLGVAVLGERPGPLAWTGVGLVAAGLAWLALARGATSSDP
jgi:DME family drug/metabolite transporter